MVGREDVEEFLSEGGLAVTGEERTLRDLAREALDESEQDGEGKAFRAVLREAEKTVIEAALVRSGGNQSKGGPVVGNHAVDLAGEAEGYFGKLAEGGEAIIGGRHRFFFSRRRKQFSVVS